MDRCSILASSCPLISLLMYWYFNRMVYGLTQIGLLFVLMSTLCIFVFPTSMADIETMSVNSVAGILSNFFQTMLGDVCIAELGFGSDDWSFYLHYDVHMRSISYSLFGSLCSAPETSLTTCDKFMNFPRTVLFTNHGFILYIIDEYI